VQWTAGFRSCGRSDTLGPPPLTPIVGPHRMDAKRSGLDPLGALACGAGLGIAAIISISVIVDAAPAGLHQPMGDAFSILVAVLVLSLLVRFLAAPFSRAIRASIAAHKAAHAICLGAAIAIVAFAFQRQRPNYRGELEEWKIEWLRLRPRHNGRTLEQWLRTLATEPGRSGSPLDIIRTHVYTNAHATVLEVPLSYDLLLDHGFYRGFWKNDLGVIIDENGGCTVPILRGTNGNCLLPLNWDDNKISPGLHNLEVVFHIGEAMSARGSTQAVVFAYESGSGSPLDIVRMQVDTNLHTIVLELPLSYDLLREPNFLNGHGKIVLRISSLMDSHYVGHSIRPLRGTNGNCLLVLNRDRQQIPPGIRQVRIELWIGENLLAVGPARDISFDKNTTSH
jgi:hypothetical protein